MQKNFTFDHRYLLQLVLVKFSLTFLLSVLLQIAFAGNIDSSQVADEFEALTRQLRQNPHETLLKADSVIALLDSEGNEHLKGRGLIVAGQAHYYLSELDKAEAAFEESASIFEKLGDREFMAKAYNNLGSICRMKGQLDRAIELFNSSLKIKREAGSTEGEIRSLTNLANVYNEKGSYHTATKLYLSALKRSDSLKMSNVSATILLNLGIASNSNNSPERAKSFYHRSLELFEKNGNFTGLSTAYNNLGSIYLNHNLLDSAQIFFDKSLEVARQNKDLLGEAYALTNIGQTHLAAKNYPEAIDNLTRSLEIFIGSGDPVRVAENQYYLAQAFMDSGNLNKAEFFIRQSVSTIDSLGVKTNHDIAYEIYKDILVSRGNYTKALEVADTLKALLDRKYDRSKSQIYEDLLANYQLDRQDQQIALREKEIDTLKKEARIDQLNFKISILFIVVFILVGLTVIFILNERKKKLKLRKALSEKQLQKSEAVNLDLSQQVELNKKILTELALNISEKNKFLNDILNHLKSDASLKETRQRIRQYLRSDQRLEEFYQEINFFLHEFREKLKCINPKITERDLRLCALLKQGLSSKEIASLFNISDKSVDMARYRLRKKLNIPRDQSIEEFLEELG